MRKFLFIVTLLLLLVTLVQLWMTQEHTEQKKAVEAAETAASSTIGGSFALTDQTGKILHDTDFRGRVMLVFFGFTNCPDICPVTVATLSKTMELLGDKANQVAPIFITVDPGRDTPAALKSYLANFDKRMVGLTGTDTEIKQVADAYKAYYAKAEAPGGKDYGVNHSGYIYLMDKTGKFVTPLAYDTTPQNLATAVKPYLN